MNYKLYEKEKCLLQLGGSDQWGNIINGIDLIKKVNTLKNKNTNAHAITSPLITTANGKKMGIAKAKIEYEKEIYYIVKDEKKRGRLIWR